MTLHKNDLIVQAELVRVADGSQIWGDQYKGKFADIFAAQEGVAAKVVKAMRPPISGMPKVCFTRDDSTKARRG